jgi:hypothetical protein
VYHTGSYFDGLRCGTADEFDLNLILDLKPIESMLLVTTMQCRPPYLVS